MAEAERIIGTPDIPDAAGADPETPDQRPRGRRRIVVLFTVAALAYALDLVSKMIVVAKLEHHAPIEIIGDWLKFEAIRNAGAAFGFGQAFTVIFTVIAAAVIVVIVRLARKLYSLPWAIALGLLLGGALGNLTDRIFRSPGRLPGRGRRLHRAQALRGLQPRRLGDRLRRHPDRAPVLHGAGPGRHRPQGLTSRGEAGWPQARRGAGPSGILDG